VCHFLLVGYTRTGDVLVMSYDVIFAPVSSLGGGCGKSAPSVVEQPFVMETCNFGYICTLAGLIDSSAS